MLDLARADAEGEGTERPVRRRVAVAADDRHPRQRAALLGADDVDDPLAGVAHRVVGDAELGGVAAQRSDLPRRHLIGDRTIDVGGRNVVILGGDRQLGAANAAAGESQPLERLWAGHLVDEVEIDVEQIRLAGRAGADDVAIPDLRRQGGGGHGRWGFASLSTFEILFLANGKRIERRRP